MVNLKAVDHARKAAVADGNSCCQTCGMKAKSEKEILQPLSFCQVTLRVPLCSNSTETAARTLSCALQGTPPQYKSRAEEERKI